MGCNTSFHIEQFDDPIKPIENTTNSNTSTRVNSSYNSPQIEKDFKSLSPKDLCKLLIF